MVQNRGIHLQVRTLIPACARETNQQLLACLIYLEEMYSGRCAYTHTKAGQIGARWGCDTHLTAFSISFASHVCMP